jgi:hypothetical protein
MSILDEQCVIPKSSDAKFARSLYKHLLVKNSDDIGNSLTVINSSELALLREIASSIKRKTSGCASSRRSQSLFVASSPMMTWFATSSRPTMSWSSSDAAVFSLLWKVRSGKGGADPTQHS